MSKFVLSWNNGEDTLVFPILPNGGIELSEELANSTFEAESGEIQMIGLKKLRKFDIDSFFPTKTYPFMNPFASSDGWEYVRKIESVIERGIPFRAVYIDSRGKTVFNMPISITSFSYVVDQAQDIQYKLSAVEYRFANTTETELAEQSEPEDADIVTAQEAAESITTGSATPSSSGDVEGDIPKDADGNPIEYEKLYTEDEVLIGAKSLSTEFGGAVKGLYISADGYPATASTGKWVNLKTLMAALAWTHCNRIDAGYAKHIKDLGFGSSTGSQFAYIESKPTVVANGKLDLVELVRDVYNRWSREHAGAVNVGRVLPKEYMWYGSNNDSGKPRTSGVLNKIRNSYSKPFKIWDYSLATPYADLDGERS